MKKVMSLFLALTMVFALASCGSEPAESPAPSEEVKSEEVKAESEEALDPNGTHVITDMIGREVEIPNEIHTIVCTGANALRMVSYLNAEDMVIGVENNEHKVTNARRDYSFAKFDTFKDLPVIGKGGGVAYTAYPEEIIKVNPDVILSCYVPEAADQLQNETGIPVVSIKYPPVGFINDEFYKALRFTGELTHTEERAEELLSYIDGLKKDLNDRTKDIPDEEKPTVYAGAVTFSGGHGIAGTYANFGPFIAINAKNVTDETGEDSAFEVDLEKIVVWDPDYIFLDPANMSLVNEEYAANPDFFNSLTAVKEGKLYTMPSFNYYSTNITYCLMDAYFAGKTIYPEQFADVDMREKGNEILEAFLGIPYYDEMEDNGLFYGQLTLGE